MPRYTYSQRTFRFLSISLERKIVSRIMLSKPQKRVSYMQMQRKYVGSIAIIRYAAWIRWTDRELVERATTRERCETKEDNKKEWKKVKAGACSALHLRWVLSSTLSRGAEEGARCAVRSVWRIKRRLCDKKPTNMTKTSLDEFISRSTLWFGLNLQCIIDRWYLLCCSCESHTPLNHFYTLDRSLHCEMADLVYTTSVKRPNFDGTFFDNCTDKSTEIEQRDVNTRLTNVPHKYKNATFSKKISPPSTPLGFRFTLSYATHPPLSGIRFSRLSAARYWARTETCVVLAASVSRRETQSTISSLDSMSNNTSPSVSIAPRRYRERQCKHRTDVYNSKIIFKKQTNT